MKRPVTPETLEDAAGGLTMAIDKVLQEGFGQRIGFALVLFDFGERGSCAYASNAKREDVIRELEDIAARLRKGG